MEGAWRDAGRGAAVGLAAGDAPGAGGCAHCGRLGCEAASCATCAAYTDNPGDGICGVCGAGRSLTNGDRDGEFDHEDDDLEPYCSRCDAGIAIFWGRDGWHHWRLANGGQIEIYDADHAPAVAWRDGAQ